MGSPIRYITVAIALALGVFVAVAEPLKAQNPKATASPAKSRVPEASVRHIEETEVRDVPSGKASIRFLAEGQEAFVGLLRMDGGGKVPEHRDASEEYIHILKGSGTMFLDDKPHAIKPGTTIFMPKGVKVRYENGPDELMAIQIFAGPESATKYQSWKVRQ
tara:strand:+ start:169 stop:654 length:486 start_codon:yes stop_codon:yes gene_type:complete